MADDTDNMLNDLFHRCAWAAYVDQAVAQQGWPDSTATKRRAYRYYEEALARKNRQRVSASGPPELVD